MKKKLFAELNKIADTYQTQTPPSNDKFPCIIFYFLTNQPALTYDNTYSNSRRIMVNIDIYDDEYPELLSEQVEQLIKKDFKGVLRNEREIEEDEGIIGNRFEFEINEVKL